MLEKASYDRKAALATRFGNYAVPKLVYNGGETGVKSIDGGLVDG